jgi:hypothetical protein
MNWDLLNPLAMVGGPTGGLSDDITTGGLGSSGILPSASVMHPDHPFFWFAAIAAATFGLVGASTHLRVGPFKASASAGKD